MIKIRNLSYSYNRKSPVLNEISLSIDTGYNLLIGENGSGKTTLIKNLTGIFPLQHGEIILGSLPVSSKEYKKRFLICHSHLMSIQN